MIHPHYDPRQILWFLRNYWKHTRDNMIVEWQNRYNDMDFSKSQYQWLKIRYGMKEEWGAALNTPPYPGARPGGPATDYYESPDVPENPPRMTVRRQGASPAPRLVSSTARATPAAAGHVSSGTAHGHGLTSYGNVTGNTQPTYGAANPTPIPVPVSAPSPSSGDKMRTIGNATRRTRRHKGSDIMAHFRNTASINRAYMTESLNNTSHIIQQYSDSRNQRGLYDFGMLDQMNSHALPTSSGISTQPIPTPQPAASGGVGQMPLTSVHLPHQQQPSNVMAPLQFPGQDALQSHLSMTGNTGSYLDGGLTSGQRTDLAAGMSSDMGMGMDLDLNTGMDMDMDMETNAFMPPGPTSTLNMRSQPQHPNTMTDYNVSMNQMQDFNSMNDFPTPLGNAHGGYGNFPSNNTMGNGMPFVTESPSHVGMGTMAQQQSTNTGHMVANEMAGGMTNARGVLENTTLFSSGQNSSWSGKRKQPNVEVTLQQPSYERGIPTLHAAAPNGPTTPQYGHVNGYGYTGAKNETSAMLTPTQTPPHPQTTTTFETPFSRQMGAPAGVFNTPSDFYWFNGRHDYCLLNARHKHYANGGIYFASQIECFLACQPCPTDESPGTRAAAEIPDSPLSSTYTCLHIRDPEPDLVTKSIQTPAQTLPQTAAQNFASDMANMTVPQQTDPETVQQIVSEIVQETVPQTVQKIVSEIIQETFPETVEQANPEADCQMDLEPVEQTDPKANCQMDLEPVQQTDPRTVQEIVSGIVQETFPEPGEVVDLTSPSVDETRNGAAVADAHAAIHGTTFSNYPYSNVSNNNNTATVNPQETVYGYDWASPMDNTQVSQPQRMAEAYTADATPHLFPQNGIEQFPSEEIDTMPTLNSPAENVKITVSPWESMIQTDAFHEGHSDGQSINTVDIVDDEMMRRLIREINNPDNVMVNDQDVYAAGFEDVSDYFGDGSTDFEVVY